MSASIFGDGITLDQVSVLMRSGYPSSHIGWQVYNHAGAAIPAVDTLYLYFFPVVRSIRVNLMRARTTTGGAGSAIKFAAWLNDPSTGRPYGTPVFGQNTGLATTGSGTWQDLPVSDYPLSAGGIWFGSKLTGTLPAMVVQTAGGYGSGLISFSSADFPASPQGNLSLAAPYADDIMATDLTGATLAPTSSGVPAFALGWA